MVTGFPAKDFLESAELMVTQGIMDHIDGQIVARRREVKEELDKRLKAYIDAQVIYNGDPEVQRLTIAVRNYDAVAVQELAEFRKPLARSREAFEKQLKEYDMLTDALVMQGANRAYREGVRQGLRLVTGLMASLGVVVKECTGTDIRDMFALVMKSPEDDVAVDRLADRLGRLNGMQNG